jgi:hypothetical protein
MRGRFWRQRQNGLGCSSKPSEHSPFHSRKIRESASGLKVKSHERRVSFHRCSNPEGHNLFSKTFSRRGNS